MTGGDKGLQWVTKDYRDFFLLGVTNDYTNLFLTRTFPDTFSSSILHKKKS